MDLGDLGMVSRRLADPTSSMTGLPQPPTHDPAYPGDPPRPPRRHFAMLSQIAPATT